MVCSLRPFSATYNCVLSLGYPRSSGALLSRVSFAIHQDEIAQVLGPFEKDMTATSGWRASRWDIILVVNGNGPPRNRILHDRFLASAAFQPKVDVLFSEFPPFASVLRTWSPSQLEPATRLVARCLTTFWASRYDKHTWGCSFSKWSILALGADPNSGGSNEELLHQNGVRGKKRLVLANLWRLS